MKTSVRLSSSWLSRTSSISSGVRCSRCCAWAAAPRRRRSAAETSAAYFEGLGLFIASGVARVAWRRRGRVPLLVVGLPLVVRRGRPRAVGALADCGLVLVLAYDRVVVEGVEREVALLVDVPDGGLEVGGVRRRERAADGFD